MHVKKQGGKIFGATLTSAERKAMDIEIAKASAKFQESHGHELDAIILWQLRTQFGFGKKRLRKFYENFKSELDGLLERYSMTDYVDDAIWLCSKKLKDELNIDVREWHEEVSNERP